MPTYRTNKSPYKNRYASNKLPELNAKPEPQKIVNYAIYRVFSKDKTHSKDTAERVYNLGSIYFVMPLNYCVGNFPITGTKQLLNISMSQAQIDDMMNTPKTIVKHMPMRMMDIHDTKWLVNEYFMLAPNVNDNRSLAEPQLPVVYKITISHKIESDLHYQISFQALLGGCIDGLLNLARFDKTFDPAENENLPKHLPENSIAKKSMIYKDEEIANTACPHIHQVNAINAPLKSYNKISSEYLPECENRDLSAALAYMCKTCNIDSIRELDASYKIADIIKGLQTKTIKAEPVDTQKMAEEINESNKSAKTVKQQRTLGILN